MQLPFPISASNNLCVRRGCCLDSSATAACDGFVSDDISQAEADFKQADFMVDTWTLSEENRRSWLYEPSFSISFPQVAFNKLLVEDGVAELCDDSDASTENTDEDDEEAEEAIE